MQKPRFSPFKKPIERVDATDLEVLRQTQEGWYVEYKSRLPNARDLGKSISSLANQYGGWLFIGIEEDGDQCAGAFPGIPVSDLRTAEQRIQKAVATHVNPSPHYEMRALKGPCAELGIGSDSAIVVLCIPEGPEAPYVHSSGRIYRRVGDASEPRAESDRAQLDALWERTRDLERRLEDRLLERPLRSKGEDNTPYVQLYFFCDPTHPEPAGTALTIDQFAEVMRSVEGHLFTMSYTNCFPMAGGFVARHVEQNDPYNMVVTWRYCGLGNSVLSFPLSSRRLDRTRKSANFLDGYENARGFEEALQAEGHTSGWVIDLNLIFAFFVSAVQQHSQLLKAEGLSTPIHAKVAVEGVWRRIPFLDTASFVEACKKRGVPLIQDEAFLAPLGTDRRSLLLLPMEPGEIDPSEPGEERAPHDAAVAYLQASILFAVTLNGLGVPSDVALDSFKDVVGIVTRASEVHRKNSALNGH